MAGRQLQRLLKQQGQNVDIPPDESESEEEDEEEISGQPAFNPFALLTDDEDEEAIREENTSSDEEEDAQRAHESPRRAAVVAPPGAKEAKKGRQPAAQAPQQPEEDIDAILQELNITPINPSGVSSPARGTASTSAKPLLALNAKALKPDEELKRMFGRSALSTHDDDEDGGGAYAGASRRIRRLAARGLLVKHQLRPGVVIAPKDTWPRLDASLGMKLSGRTENGRPIFTYTHSPAFEAVQQLYEECQATFDPNAIGALLNSHPYHPDALLTMADLYHSMGEHAPADEMVERCVYVMESAWPPTLTSALLSGSGACIAYEEASVPLFLGLFRYMNSLGRRGLHRTALEMCKLLLALNDDDPQGALLVLDYFAVRSGQYAFLQRFVEEYGGGDGAAALLPNMVYSLALARWYQEQEAASEGKGKRGNKRQGTGGSGGTSKEPSAAEAQSSSEDLLVKALLLHPLAMVRLHTKLQEKGVGTGPEWTLAMSSPPFSTATDGGSASLSHLVDIFVERQHLMWKAGPVQEWLLRGVQRVVDATATKDASALPDGISAQGWAAVRDQAFHSSETNQYRHLRLHEYSDAAPRLPAEEMHGVHAAPAVDGEEVLRAAAAEVQRLRGEGLGELAESHPLMALLRSLLPWVDQGEQPDYEADEREDRGRGGEGGGQ